MAASLIVKNPGGSEVFIADVGTNIPAAGQVTFDDRENLLKLARSISLRILIQAATLVLNDGTSDLSVLDALGTLDGIWSNAASSLNPIIPAGFIFNARLSWNSVDQVSVGTAGNPSLVTDSRGARSIAWKGVLNANITVTGPGGLQTGSVEAANTWYKVLVIADSTGVNAVSALLVPEGTAFSQAGYDIFRRVGYVRNNGSSAFFKFGQGGASPVRFILYDEDFATLTALLDGAATVPTAVSLASFVPPIGRAEVSLGLGFRTTGGAATDQFLLRPSGATTTSPVTRVAPGALIAQKMRQMADMFTDGSQQIEYAVSNAADRADIAVAGYYDEL